MTVFVLGSLTLCSWIVFQINSREKLFYYPITFASCLKKKKLPVVVVEEKMVEQIIGTAPNHRKVPKFRTVVEGIVNIFALHKIAVKKDRMEPGSDKGKGREQTDQDRESDAV